MYVCMHVCMYIYHTRNTCLRMLQMLKFILSMHLLYIHCHAVSHNCIYYIFTVMQFHIIAFITYSLSCSFTYVAYFWSSMPLWRASFDNCEHDIGQFIIEVCTSYSVQIAIV